VIIPAADDGTVGIAAANQKLHTSRFPLIYVSIVRSSKYYIEDHHQSGDSQYIPAMKKSVITFLLFFITGTYTEDKRKTVLTRYFLWVLSDPESCVAQSP
jgi:hypothetical protein